HVTGVQTCALPIYRTRGHPVIFLMGIQAKHPLPDEMPGALNHLTHIGVPVLYRIRKMPLLPGCAHSLVFFGWHPIIEHQRFRSATDSGIQRAYSDRWLPGFLVLPERRRSEFALTGAGHPERPIGW